MTTKQTMQWEKLLSTTRSTDEAQAPKDTRNEFERDFGRILFSNAFRRLMDKTQVFPLPTNDHVHNRLIHSAEVSYVGRSIARLAFDKLGDDVKAHGRHAEDVVAAACLMHDLGNPPFGHAGESTIGHWFEEWCGIDMLEDVQKEDLKKFEGNAQTFRVAVSAEMRRPGGMRLTQATLAASSKYPHGSLSGRSKFGYFQAEREHFAVVAESVGLIRVDDKDSWWCRHPLAYLVEAADDICYRIMDFEDGVHLGLVEEGCAKNILANIGGAGPNDDLSRCRALAINALIEQAASGFVEKYESIMAGEDVGELVAVKGALEKLQSVSHKQCYQSEGVERLECMGDEVLAGLLKKFVDAALTKDGKGHANKQAAKLRRHYFFPSDDDSVWHGLDTYSRLLYVTDFISGMTDTYAVRLYRQLQGFEI